jgi:carbonic anhydrase
MFTHPHQSPTHIYPNASLDVPREAMAVAAGALHKGLTPESWSPREMQQVGQAASFVFQTLAAEEAAPIATKLAQDFARNKAARGVLTHPELLGRLNRDLVQFFIEQRKTEDPPSFWEKLSARVQSFDPRRLWQKPAAKDAALQTLDDAGDTHTLRLIQRYLRGLLAHPEKLSDPTKGEARSQILGYLLPRLFAEMQDEALLGQLDDATRSKFAAVRDALQASLVKHFDAPQKALMTTPDAYDLNILGHAKGALKLAPKEFLVPEGYGKAIGDEIRIEAAQENTRADVRARGVEYHVDHTHWHLGAPEHRLAGDKRNLKGEVHIVHLDATGTKPLVMGAYIEVIADAPPNPLVQAILDRGQGAGAFSHLDILPEGAWAKGQYDHTLGTLTTASYSRGVSFYLLRDHTVQVTPEQYEALTKLMQFDEGKDTNARRPQPSYDATIVGAVRAVDARVQAASAHQ